MSSYGSWIAGGIVSAIVVGFIVFVIAMVMKGRRLRRTRRQSTTPPGGAPTTTTGAASGSTPAATNPAASGNTPWGLLKRGAVVGGASVVVGAILAFDHYILGKPIGSFVSGTKAWWYFSMLLYPTQLVTVATGDGVELVVVTWSRVEPVLWVVAGAAIYGAFHIFNDAFREWSKKHGHWVASVLGLGLLVLLTAKDPTLLALSIVAFATFVLFVLLALHYKKPSILWWGAVLVVTIAGHGYDTYEAGNAVVAFNKATAAKVADSKSQWDRDREDEERRSAAYRRQQELEAAELRGREWQRQYEMERGFRQETAAATYPKIFTGDLPRPAHYCGNSRVGVYKSDKPCP